MNFLSSLFKQPEAFDVTALLQDFTQAFDLLDVEMLVVRKNCEILFTNTKAHVRLQGRIPQEMAVHSCKNSYAASFPALCDNCPYGLTRQQSVGNNFTLEDDNGRTFQARCTVVNWTDNEPAFIFTLKDLSPEIEAQKRLHELAYIDQLTGVPNRAKLKEDFAALEGRINNGEIKGIIALIDLDNFKQINDTYGHNTGDVMLCRVVEILEKSVDFAGHLYRLGGDEFVLLYIDPADRFESEDKMQRYYEQLLSGALANYSLSHIDLECTLSAGVAMFPRDGSTLSETLRRADIAMYVAKNEGRNQTCFFASQYDTAQKFKNIYVSIQPVLTSNGRTFGYEINDRDEDDDAETPTALQEFNRTLDALGMHNLNEKHYYFINCSRQLLRPEVLANLPRDKFIVHLNPPFNEEMELYQNLKQNGYKLAVTYPNSRDVEVDVLTLTDYCLLSPKDGNLAAQRRLIDDYPGKRFVANGIDTLVEFNAAKEAGYSLFKGYYFRKPDIEKTTKEILPLKVNYLRLMALSSTEGFMDFREISNIIAADVALSYKLLRILNSAAVGLRNVTSISSAIAYLGEDNLKKWIAVLALRGAGEDKPLELVRLSLIRARMGEILAPHFRLRRSPQVLFMMGLLSLLHIAMDTTREELMKEMPVKDDIRESLLTKTGIYSDMLLFYENYEHANWDYINQFIEHHQLDASRVNEAYVSAIKWFTELSAEEDGGGGAIYKARPS